MSRLHLIDGTYELYRAHFSPRPDVRAKDGRDVKATAGLVSSIAALLRDPVEAVSHLAIAFDHPIRSFRNDLFDGYKSDEGVPPELRAQFGLVEDAVRAFGVVVWSMDRWEADDAIATGARRWRDQVDQVRIMSPDKDFGQVIEGKKVVQVDRMRQREIDEEAQIATRGVHPNSVPDYLALVGDDADGIPGVPGFGAKTACAILAVHPKLEDIPSDPRAWRVQPRGIDRLASTLRERMDDARLYRTLATLVYDVPLQETLDDLAYRGASRRVYEDFVATLGVDDLKNKPPSWRD